MADRSRDYLKQEFDDGERPTGADFADLIDSFINKETDGVRLLPNDNLSIPAGLTLANAAAGQDGTLRFTGSQVEVFQGGTWNPIGGGGAFTPVAGGPHVAFAGGNVGIGNFATAPTNKLEVPLGANTGPAERVHLGSLIVHNGQTNDAAYLSHQNVTANNTFALRQDSQANTTVNAGPGAELILQQQGTANRLRFNTTGNLFVTPAASAVVEGNTAIGTPTTARDLTVFGNAFKPGGGPFTAISDKRVKKDIRPFDLGLNELRKLNPVFYRFNGKGGTPNDGKEYVGMTAQEVAKVVPSMVRSGEGMAENGSIPDLLALDTGPLVYIMINAIRELAGRVEKLEAQLAGKEKAKK
jgi:hypothetical protein